VFLIVAFKTLSFHKVV